MNYKGRKPLNKNDVITFVIAILIIALTLTISKLYEAKNEADAIEWQAERQEPVTRAIATPEPTPIETPEPTPTTQYCT